MGIPDIVVVGSLAALALGASVGAIVGVVCFVRGIFERRSQQVPWAVADRSHGSHSGRG